MLHVCEPESPRLTPPLTPEVLYVQLREPPVLPKDRAIDGLQYASSTAIFDVHGLTRESACVYVLRMHFSLVNTSKAVDDAYCDPSIMVKYLAYGHWVSTPGLEPTLYTFLTELG